MTAGISGAAPTTSAPPRPRAKRALGQVPTEPPVYDIPMLQALALWAAVLVVVVSTLADLVLVLLDPRVRAAGRPPG